MEFIEAVDLGSIFAIGSFQKQTPWLIPIFQIIAYAGLPWVLAAVAVVASAGLMVRGRGSGMLVLLFLTSLTISLVAQRLVLRPGPDLATRVGGLPSRFSFPNNAAAVSAGTFAVLLMSVLPLWKRRAWRSAASLLIGVLILAIGFSQMYLGWSYLTDVVGGWALGLALALLARWLELRWNSVAASGTVVCAGLWSGPTVRRRIPIGANHEQPACAVRAAGRHRLPR